MSLRVHLISLSCFFFTLTSGQSICHVAGECALAEFDAIFIAYDYNECLVHCQSSSLCTHFTHYESSDECLTWRDCSTFNATSCVNCYTGERSCSQYSDTFCHIPGQCHGATLDWTPVGTEYDCLDACHANDDCEFYNYDPSSSGCVLLDDCDEFDDLASCITYGCVAGERACGADDPRSYTKLMVVGGSQDDGRSGAKKDVQVIDLSGEGKVCDKPPDFPINEQSIGTFFNGVPLVCGGTNIDEQDACYFYNKTTLLWEPYFNMTVPR